MDQALVRFEGVRKTYAGNHTPAVAGLDLAIQKGEFLTLLGPSGSGKTTTLMLLAGFESPDAGRIELAGKDLTHTPVHQRNLGMVFQNYALFPHLTVAENIAFPLVLRKVKRGERKRRVEKALEMVRLEGLGHRRIAQLSGGQQQRVALARALIFDPPVVLLDEPLSALDKALRDEMQQELRAIHRNLRTTMLYVTHDQQEALTLSDRIAVFAGGHLRQLATPRELYDNPTDAFVASFVGENNLLPGTVLERDDEECRIRLECGPEVFAVPADVEGVGSRCLVALRPEHVAVAAMRADEFGDGALACRVEEAIFQGDHLRLRLTLGDGGTLTAKRPAYGSIPKIGDLLALAWQPGHARAFRADTPLAPNPGTAAAD